jgi:hypothetical protein
MTLFLIVMINDRYLQRNGRTNKNDQICRWLDNIHKPKTTKSATLGSFWLKKAADQVIKWTNENRFRISAERTKLMLIYRWNWVLEQIPRIRNCVEIEMTNHRILGLIFDQQLNWKEHIKVIRHQILLRIHQMIIIPTLRYW